MVAGGLVGLNARCKESAAKAHRLLPRQDTLTEAVVVKEALHDIKRYASRKEVDYVSLKVVLAYHKDTCLIAGLARRAIIALRDHLSGSNVPLSTTINHEEYQHL